jgi:hypothetical protein
MAEAEEAMIAVVFSGWYLVAFVVIGIVFLF